MASAPLLSVHELAVAIGSLTLCQGLSFEVSAGECWVILGRNGAGKTTLLHTLAGLRAPVRGAITFDGTPLASMSRRALARERALLPQDSSDIFPATVLETVLTGRHPHLSRWAAESQDDVRLARDALAAVGIAGADRRDVRSLSGGERRRVAVAALLAQAPRLYLLDEPSSHLDLRYQIALLDLVVRLARERDGALLMVLHDVNLAARYADRVLLLDGDATRTGPADALLDAAVLSALYGIALQELGHGRGRAYTAQRNPDPEAGRTSSRR
jgi:iron complex transport system ATP-binding protein